MAAGRGVAAGEKIATLSPIHVVESGTAPGKLDEAAFQSGDILVVPLPGSGVRTAIDTAALARDLRSDPPAEVLADDSLLLVARWGPVGRGPTSPGIRE